MSSRHHQSRRGALAEQRCQAFKADLVFTTEQTVVEAEHDLLHVLAFGLQIFEHGTVAHRAILRRAEEQREVVERAWQRAGIADKPFDICPGCGEIILSHLVGKS